MTYPKPPKKRIVSKAEYAAHLAGKATLKSGEICLQMGGILSSVITVFCGVYTCSVYGSRLFPDFLAVTLTLGIISTGLIMGAIGAGKIAEDIEPVLPPTRQNIEQLPAEETLLRASAEPTEGIEKVLLRAAVAGAETPPEQLLRADVSPAP